jgi:hypothetical protein
VVLLSPVADWVWLCLWLCLLLLLMSRCRYQELAGQHQKILQHLNHRIEKITGVVDH